MLRSASLRKQALDNGRGNEKLWGRVFCRIRTARGECSTGVLYSTSRGNEREMRDAKEIRGERGREGRRGQKKEGAGKEEEREKRREGEREEKLKSGGGNPKQTMSPLQKCILSGPGSSPGKTEP